MFPMKQLIIEPALDMFYSILFGVHKPCTNLFKLIMLARCFCSLILDTLFVRAMMALEVVVNLIY